MNTTNSKLFLFVFVVALLCLVAPSKCDRYTETMIHRICDKTLDPKFCYGTLRGNVKTPLMNIRGLAKINVDVALTFAKFVRTSIQTLEGAASPEPRVRQGYQLAKASYSAMIIKLLMAQSYAQRGQFNDMLRPIYLCDSSTRIADSIFQNVKSMHLANSMMKVLLSAVKLEVGEM